MVDHLTTVSPHRALGADRLAQMASALEAIGFEMRRHCHRIVFTSTEVEAQAAKWHLRAHGFRDQDFQIVLEYTRQWGIM